MMKKKLGILMLVIILIFVSSCGIEENQDAQEEKVDLAETIVEGMTTKQKIEQMMMIDFRQWDENLSDGVPAQDMTVLNEQVASIIRNHDFGSIILFANNIRETEPTYRLVMGLQEAATENEGIPLMIATDQEGGSVFRLGSGTALPGNMALGAAGSLDSAEAAGKIIGSELSSLGINTALAPVVDINSNANNPVIGLRSFGDDPQKVGELGTAFARGIEAFHVVACAKHFPGHGDTATDSHYGLPVVDKSLEELRNNELKPYQMLIENNIDMIMTAHILFPQIEKDTLYSELTGQEEQLPATLSDDIITKLLKDEMGFQGIVCTDSMNMSGITNSWGKRQALETAILAGADMLCMPVHFDSMDGLSDLDDVIEDIVSAVENGDIPEQRIDDACMRIMKIKEKMGILDFSEENYSLEAAQNKVGCSENRKIERKISAEAVTVVQNNHDLLPLKKNNQRKF